MPNHVQLILPGQQQNRLFSGPHAKHPNDFQSVTDQRIKRDLAGQDLRKYFRWTMTVRLFEAFMSPEALQKLGVRI